MSRTKKKKSHIIFYDLEIRRKLNAIKKAEDLTYDEMLKKYLKLPEDVLGLAQRQYREIGELLTEEYKNEDIATLMGFLWVLISKSAIGEYDIKRLMSVIEADIRVNTYRKR